jgi:hypothetical protein
MQGSSNRRHRCALLPLLLLPLLLLLSRQSRHQTECVGVRWAGVTVMRQQMKRQSPNQPQMIGCAGAAVTLAAAAAADL